MRFPMNKTVLSFVFLLFVICATSATSFAQTCTPASTAAGSLDTCFGTGGKVTTVFGISPIMYDAAVQADGKIVVVGASDYAAQNDFAVVRYNTDGTLDTSFDGDGKVSTDFDYYDEAKSVKIQADGKIVVAGRSNQFFAAARYNPDGSLDTTFDGDGKVKTDVGSATTNVESVLTIQTDGKIVLAGYRQTPSGALWTSFIVRYHPDGLLDTSFDGDGKAEISGINAIYSIVQQTDGKLLFGGVSQDSKFVVARLNGVGAVDASFGTNGIAVFSPSNAVGTAYSLAVEANGKILAAGVMRPFNSNNYVSAMARFSESGTAESSFTASGQAYSVIKDIYIQPDGKILTAGFSYLETARKGFEVMRFNDVGVPDSSFNGSGSVRLDFTEGNAVDGVSYAYALGMTADNKIFAAGVTQQDMSVNSGKIAVTRLMSGIAAPFDFDGDGKSDVSVFRPSTNVWYGFQSSNNNVSARLFGAAGDILAPSDYDGDGTTDLGVFRPSSGDWWYLNSGSGVVSTARWGQSGDVPMPADFDGDGKADFIMFRPSENVWYRWGSSGAVSITAFGAAGDKPLNGDFDGDGKADLSIFRPSSGDWWWKSGIDGSVHATHWGISTDTPVPADYDGDGKTDFAVYRSGIWYILQSGNGQARIINFGLAADQPVAADYDGDGKSDIAVFRPSEGIWYLDQSTNGFTAMRFGVSSDVAVPNLFIPEK